MKEGFVEAQSREIAAQILEKNGLVPITIEEETRAASFMKTFSKIWQGVTQKELMIFFQQLATLIEARVPIVSSLNTIGDQTENAYLKIIIQELSDDVKDGMPFSEALERHPAVFTSLIINMIRAGEVSGTLHKSVAFVAANIEKNYYLTSKIKGALYYPIFVLSIAFIIGFLVVTFILPKLTLMIKDLNVPVPWYTAVFIWIGDFMNQWWWAALLVILACVVGMFYYFQSASGRYEWEKIILKIPVIGRLAQAVYITRLAENLSALLNSGIPVVKSLTIVKEVIGNHIFSAIIDKAVEAVKAGGTISSVFMRSPEIPPIVAQITRIGEETGTLSGVLDSAAKFYNQEVEITTRNLTSLIEPVLIVILGIGVGILVVGVLMPIYNIAGQL